MKKYNEEYFSVIDKRTGKKIVDCGEEIDAIEMVSFDPRNRTYTKNQFLMGQVIDINVPKQLQTSNITISNVRENGCAPRKEQLLDASLNKLPEGEGQPVKV